MSRDDADPGPAGEAEGRFPDGFLWGAATSAYQIEGSPLADGAGPSIWYRFSHTPGMTRNGETGDVACDHYRRWREDVALMAGLGLSAYRFSIAWPRVLPAGVGAVNTAGLGFYDRLVDALLERGIEPWVTLYHWDLPAALDDRGGWLNPDSAMWFADYTRTVVRALGDRVKGWFTLNEPWVIVDAGYLHGAHAPGHRSLFEAAIAARNLLRAHGAAVQAFRAESRGRIGPVVNVEPKRPATETPEDLRATALADAYMNRQFLDPIFLGRNPEELPGIFGEAWVEYTAGDFALIGEPVDFIGLNYYTRAVVAHDAEAWPVPARPVRQPGAEITDIGWEVEPESFTKVLLWLRERYGDRPVVITENGAAFPDPPAAAGEHVEDPRRVAYLRSHLRALREALRQGADVRGYFAWSLLDNVEWSLGTSMRFGLFHVNHATGERTPKSSADFYRRVIETHGAALDG
jgi:beta-glucosidase